MRAFVAPCCVAALLTAVAMFFVLPGGSPNLDELAYRQQAVAIAHGHLTLPAQQYGTALRPYLSGFNDDGEVVFKYQPLWPAVIAGADTLGLGTKGLRLILAGLLPAAGAWLASEALGQRRRPALITAWLLAICPMVWVQSASLLAYQPSLVLLTATLAAFLAYQRTRRSLLGLLCGLASAAALFHRAFDAVVVLGPAVAMYLLVTRNRAACMAATRVAVVAALGPLAVGFHNHRVTGNALRLPFNLAGGADRFGFGRRASFPIDGIEPPNFTPGQGLKAMAASVVQFGAWAPLGLLGVALAVTALWRRRSNALQWVLVAPAFAVAVSYVFWWGSANLTTFNLHRVHGPAYHYFAVVPIAALGASAIDELLRIRRQRARLSWLVLPAAVLLVVSAFWLQSNLALARNASQARHRKLEAVSNLESSGVVFVEPVHSLVDGRFVDQPYLRVLLPDLADSRPLVALDLSGHRSRTMVELGVEQAVVVQTRGPFEGFFDEGLSPASTAQPVALVVGSRLEFVLSLTESRPAATAFVRHEGVVELVGIDPSGRARVQLDAAFLADASSVVVGVMFTDGPRYLDQVEQIACQVDVSAENGTLTVALPCRTTHRYVFPDGTWLDAPEQVPMVLDVRSVS